MCSVRNAVPFLVCNLDAFVLTVGLCFVLFKFVFEHVMFSNSTGGLLNNFKTMRSVRNAYAEHCYVACCYQVVQNNSNDGINSCKACNTSNLHTL